MSLPLVVALSVLANPDGSSGVSFKLPYSMGTHDGVVGKVNGTISYDPKRPGAVSGALSVPIESIRTGNEQRDCHMREALGLDYAKSDYPKEHVCSDAHTLPDSGRNAVVYRDIRFEVTGISGPGGVEPRFDRECDVEVDGKWTIHGVTHPARVPMKLSPEGSGFRLRGRMPFSLKAYGIEVKSAHVLFLSISVDDSATAIFDLSLGP
jgi:polyisoprenoid-binding protein YceI